MADTNAENQDHSAVGVDATMVQDGHSGSADAIASAAAEHGGGSTVGMPQLDPSTYPHQIFWLVVALVAIYFILTRIAIPRIGGTIENRQRAIARDLDRAAELKKQAEAADVAYAEALRKARTEAGEIVETTKAKIQKDLDAAVAKADDEIGAETEKAQARIAETRAEADTSVVEVAKATARALAEALIPGVAGGDALDKAVAAKVKG